MSYQKKVLILLFFVTCFLWAQSDVERLAFGREAYERESYLEALDSIRTVLKNNPSYGDAYHYLAKVYYALEQYREAEEAAQKALRYNKLDTESMVLLANCYRELGHYQRAEEMYKDIIKQYPAMAAAHRELGFLYLRQNRFSLAFQSIQRAMRYDSDDWQNVVALGKYYQVKGNNTEAESSFAQALRVEPRRRETHLALGKFYFEIGNYEKSVQVLKRAVELFDDFVSGRQILGDAFLALGKFAEAAGQYEWLEQKKVYHGPAQQAFLFYKMGMVYAESDQSKAREYYQKALQVAPKHQFYEVGYQDYIQMKEPIGSEWREQEARRIYGEAKTAKANGDMKLFFVFLQRVLKLDPYFKEARRDVVDFYESRGMWAEAYEELQVMKRFHYDLRVRDKLSRYDWEIAHGSISIDKPIFYVYRGLVFIESDFLNMAQVYQNLFLDYSNFFGKFKFRGGDIRQVNSTKDMLSFLRSEEYDFFIRGKLHKRRDTIHFEIVDGNNITIAEKSFPFDEKTLREGLWRVVSWLDEVLPTFYILKKEVTRRQYVMGAGSLQGVKTGEMWVAFDPKTLEAIMRLSVKTVKNTESLLEAMSSKSNLEYKDKERLYFIREKDFQAKDLTKLKFILGY